MKVATPFILAGVAAKTKNPQAAQINSNIMKSLTVGKIFPLTDLHGIGLKLNLM